MNQLLEKLTIDDKKVIFADCCATASGFVSLEERFIDFDKRFPPKNKCEFEERIAIRRTYNRMFKDISSEYDISFANLEYSNGLKENKNRIIYEIQRL